MDLFCTKKLRMLSWVVSCLFLSQPLVAIPTAYTFDGQSFTVQAYDLAHPSNAPTVYLPRKHSPNGLYYEGLGAFTLSPDGSKAFVSNSILGKQESFLINLGTGKVKKAFASPGVITSAAFSQDGSFLYITEFSGFVIVVDLNEPADQVRTSIPVGFAPKAIAITPDNSKAYVCGYTRIDETNALAIQSQATSDFLETGRIAVIDLHSNKIITILNASNGFSLETPYDMVISPDGLKLYVTDNSADTVVVINTTANTEDTGISPINVGESPQGIDITPDGSKVYVACNNGVYIIDTSNPKAPSSVTLNYPAVDVAVTPDGSKACVCCTGELSLIDVKAGTIDWSIPGRTYDIQIDVAGIDAPSKFRGKLTYSHKKHKVILSTSWKQSSAKDVKKYEIFNFNTKVATISAKKDLCQKITPTQPEGKITPPYILGLDTKYRIRAVDKSGNVSSFIQLSVSKANT